MKILHLAPHYGGGVKTVILGWVMKDKNNEHILLSLGYADEEIKKICNDNNIKLYDRVNHQTIITFISDIDIFLIHYWNHPLLSGFLVKNQLPKCRLITWCHVYGFFAPYQIPNNIVELSDKFVFTSPISYKLDFIKNFSEDKFFDIWSTGGIEKYKNIIKKKQKKLNLLYIGTIDYSKLRKDFIELCEDIFNEIPEATITICGDGSSMPDVIDKICKSKFSKNFKLTGRITNLIPYLEKADIFLYPLTYTHYGTCEQALGEAMSCGIVPIVFNNPCEKEIVEDGISGCVVNSPLQCVHAVDFLYNNIEEGYYSILSDNAKKRGQEKYDINLMIHKWDKLFSEIKQKDKTEKQIWKNEFEGLLFYSTFSFLSSLDKKTADIFYNYLKYDLELKNQLTLNPQWKSENKGSIKQYLKYYPDDINLLKFQEKLENI